MIFYEICPAVPVQEALYIVVTRLDAMDGILRYMDVPFGAWKQYIKPLERELLKFVLYWTRYEKMKSIHWQYDNGLQHFNPPASLKSWLCDTGSFIQRLKRHGIADPQIKVINQSWQFPLFDEIRVLGVRSRTYALVREVIIFSEKRVWMFARTVFPREMLTGKERQFSRLKNRSLGSLLFHDPTVQRGEFEFALLQPAMEWHKKIGQHAAISSKELWARRSMFYIRNKSLLLSEVFLPEMECECLAIKK